MNPKPAARKPSREPWNKSNPARLKNKAGSSRWGLNSEYSGDLLVFNGYRVVAACELTALVATAEYSYVEKAGATLEGQLTFR